MCVFNDIASNPYPEQRRGHLDPRKANEKALLRGPDRDIPVPITSEMSEIFGLDVVSWKEMLAACGRANLEAPRCRLGIQFGPCDFEYFNGLGKAGDDPTRVRVVLPELFAHEVPRDVRRRLGGEAAPVEKDDVVLHLRLLCEVAEKGGWEGGVMLTELFEERLAKADADWTGDGC
jgi:hypothetical protein